MEGHQKFLKRELVKIVEAKYRAKLKFPSGGEGGVQNKKPVRGV